MYTDSGVDSSRLASWHVYITSRAKNGYYGIAVTLIYAVDYDEPDVERQLASTLSTVEERLAVQ